MNGGKNMKHTLKKIGGLFCLTLVVTMVGCGTSKSISSSDPVKNVPAKAELVENLDDNGYTITEHTNVEGSDLAIDRVIAEKGNKYIDITYGLNAEDAEKVFSIYCELYNEDYYILARNGNYVYCVSDKKTFSKAGFTSTDNIGVQYINE